MSRIYNLKAVVPPTGVYISDRSTDVPTHGRKLRLEGRLTSSGSQASPLPLEPTNQHSDVRVRDSQLVVATETAGIQSVRRQVQQLQLREQEVGNSSHGDGNPRHCWQKERRGKTDEGQKLNDTQTETPSPSWQPGPRVLSPQTRSFTINARGSQPLENTPKPPGQDLIKAVFTPPFSVSPFPSPTPSVSPSLTPSVSPSPTLSVSPSPTLSVSPSPTLSVSPSPTLSVSPSPTLSVYPSPILSVSPSPSPTPLVSPTLTPTLSPSPNPTPLVSPTLTPTLTPTLSPSPSPSPTPTRSSPLFSIRSASGGPAKRGTTITITPRRPATGSGVPVGVSAGVPEGPSGVTPQTPAGAPKAAVGGRKKRYPTVEEIEVIGGYQNLENSCLLKLKRPPKAVRVCFDDCQLERVCEYPSEASLLASLPGPDQKHVSEGAVRAEPEGDGQDDDEEEEGSAFMVHPSKSLGAGTGTARVLRVDESCRR